MEARFRIHVSCFFCIARQRAFERKALECIV